MGAREETTGIHQEGVGASPGVPPGVEPSGRSWYCGEGIGAILLFCGGVVTSILAEVVMIVLLGENRRSRRGFLCK